MKTKVTETDEQKRAGEQGNVASEKEEGMNTSAIITIEQIYGKPLAELHADPRWPKGMRGKEFVAIVPANMPFLDRNLLCLTNDYDTYAPRIILEPIPKPKTRRVVKFVALDRPARANDYFEDSRGQFVRGLCEANYPNAFERREEEEIIKPEPAVFAEPLCEDGILPTPPAKPTVESRYGKPFEELTPPKGYKFRSQELALPKKGENYVYLNTHGEIVHSAALYDFTLDPYLILDPLPPSIVFEPDGEPRLVMKREWVRNQRGEIVHARRNWKGIGQVYKRREITMYERREELGDA